MIGLTVLLFWLAGIIPTWPFALACIRHRMKTYNEREFRILYENGWNPDGFEVMLCVLGSCFCAVAWPVYLAGVWAWRMADRLLDDEGDRAEATR